LAREPACDDIDGNSVSLKSGSVEGSDIFVALHFRPMLRQHAPAEWIDLAEGHGFKPTCPLKAKGEAAVPGKSAGGIELTGKAAAQQDPQAELISKYRRRLSMALN
jgi:hypothetical protein